MIPPPQDFAAAVAVQAEQLTNWKTKLQPQIFQAIEDYLRKSNDENLPRCYRGQDIVEIILEWPNLSPAYADVNQPKPSAQDVI